MSLTPINPSPSSATFAFIKQLLAILLLTGVFFGTTGIHIVFKYRQYLVRKEIKRAIKAGVPEHELVVIEITDNNIGDVEWIEDHEFRLNGRMYDVIRKIVGIHSIKYYCIDDKQESILFADLESLTRKINDGKSTDRDCSGFVFSLLAHIVMDDHNYDMSFIDQDIKYFTHDLQLPASGFCLIKESPPEMI